MIQFRIAKSGDYYSEISGKRIQSAYNPLKEAFNFLEKEIQTLTSPALEKKTLLIIFGVSSGNLLKAAFQLGYKHIIALYRYSECKSRLETVINELQIDQPHPNESIKLIKVEQNSTLDSILATSLSPDVIKNIKVTAWPESLKQDQHLQGLYQKMPQWIQRQLSSISTTALFGEKWLLNTVKNRSHFKRYHSIHQNNLPIIITAAGSSLRNAIPWIIEQRKHFILLALSASISTLAEFDITPDFIIQTDPGYWSAIMSGKAIQNYSNKTWQPLLIMPFTAALPFSIQTRDVIQIDHQHWLDRFFESGINSAFSVPETGSAACTALQIATQITTIAPIFMGLDLQNEKELHHAINHLSIDYQKRDETRTNSLQQKLYQLSQKNNSKALSVFHHWFQQKEEEGIVFYRMESPNSVRSKRMLTLDQATAYIEKHFSRNPITDINSIVYQLPSTSINLDKKLSTLKHSIENKDPLYSEIIQDWFTHLTNPVLIDKKLTNWIKKATYWIGKHAKI